MDPLEAQAALCAPAEAINDIEQWFNDSDMSMTSAHWQCRCPMFTNANGQWHGTAQYDSNYVLFEVSIWLPMLCLSLIYDMNHVVSDFKTIPPNIRQVTMSLQYQTANSQSNHFMIHFVISPTQVIMKLSANALVAKIAALTCLAPSS